MAVVGGVGDLVGFEFHKFANLTQQMTLMLQSLIFQIPLKTVIDYKLKS